MMIKYSLRLIFVLVYKSTYLWSDSEKRNHFGMCFVVFNELLIFVIFLPRNFCQRKWGLFYSSYKSPAPN